MRPVCLAAACVVGMMAMAKTGTAQNKKADPPKQAPAKDEAPPPAPFTEWVKFEHLDGKGGVEATFPKVAAAKTKGGKVWVLRSTDGKFATIHPGDRFTLKDGTVWVVDRDLGGTGDRISLEVHKAP